MVSDDKHNFSSLSLTSACKYSIIMSMDPLSSCLLQVSQPRPPPRPPQPTRPSPKPWKWRRSNWRWWAVTTPTARITAATMKTETSAPVWVSHTLSLSSWSSNRCWSLSWVQFYCKNLDSCSAKSYARNWQSNDLELCELSKRMLYFLTAKYLGPFEQTLFVCNPLISR